MLNVPARDDYYELHAPCDEEKLLLAVKPHHLLMATETAEEQTGTGVYLPSIERLMTGEFEHTYTVQIPNPVYKKNDTWKLHSLQSVLSGMSQGDRDSIRLFFLYTDPDRLCYIHPNYEVLVKGIDKSCLISRGLPSFEDHVDALLNSLSRLLQDSKTPGDTGPILDGVGSTVVLDEVVDDLAAAGLIEGREGDYIIVLGQRLHLLDTVETLRQMTSATPGHESTERHLNVATELFETLTEIEQLHTDGDIAYPLPDYRARLAALKPEDLYRAVQAKLEATKRKNSRSQLSLEADKEKRDNLVLSLYKRLTSNGPGPTNYAVRPRLL